MNGELILDAMDYVGDDLLDEYFALRGKYEARKAKKLRTKRRWISLAAACLAAVMIGTYAAQYIPKEYDLEYEDSQGGAVAAMAERNVWIYYVNQNNKIKRERVRLKPTIRNRFTVWKHLNGIGDEVWLMKASSIRNDVKRRDDGSLIWDENVETRVTAYITISENIKEYEGYEDLLKSLEKTMLECADECRIIFKDNHK